MIIKGYAHTAALEVIYQLRRISIVNRAYPYTPRGLKINRPVVDEQAGLRVALHHP